MCQENEQFLDNHIKSLLDILLRVRMSLTDTDERVEAAAARLRSPEAAALFAG